MRGNARRPEVVVVGSVNLDVIMRAPRFPDVGETVTGATVLDALGGKGANQAVAAARYGAAVALVACVGDDPAGHAALETLRSEGVDVTACRVTPEVPTGRATIVVDPDGHNSIVVADGANGALTPADVRAVEDLISAAAVVVCQLEIRLETVSAALATARSQGVLSCLNTAPARPIEALAAAPDVLVANRLEAQQLTESRDGGLDKVAVDLQQRYGSQAVAITDGERGAIGRYGQRTFAVPALRVNVKDTTGAGDAFMGALAASLAAGESMDRAVSVACAVGSLATERAGAMPSLPRREAINAALASRRQD